MAEECVFYYNDRDYCCRLLKQSNKEYVVDSDWVHRYCWAIIIMIAHTIKIGNQILHQRYVI